MFQMDDIRLPMVRGRMDDISQEEAVSSQPDASDSTPVDSMSSQGAKAIYEREANIVLDYSALDDDFKDVRFKQDNFLS
jgi:structural maintenance of chromosome 1